MDELGHNRSSEDKTKQRNTRCKRSGEAAKGHGIWLLSPTTLPALQKPSEGTRGLERLSQVMIVSEQH